MSFSQNLTPFFNSTRDTITKADAPAFLEGLLALTPLPSGKTVEQLVRYDVQVGGDGSITVATNFKS